MTMVAQPRSGLPRSLLILLGMAAATVVIAGLRGASSLIGPVFFALVLTIVVHPVRRWLLRRRIPSWAASLICLVLVYALLLGLAVALVLATARFATLLPSYEAEFNDDIDKASSWLDGIGIGEQQIQQILQGFDLSQLTDVLTSLLSDLLNVVSDLVFILTLAVFLAMDAGVFPRMLEAARSTRGSLVDALTSFAAGTRRYLWVSTVFGLIVATLDTIALAILGIPVPLLWGLLAFITNYIPNVGFVIGLVPPAVLALLSGGPGLMIAVIVVYSVLNLTIQTIIQPKIVGDAVGLSTTLTFLSLVFWSWVFGAIGALLAVPMSLLTKALLVDGDPQSRWLVPLLSNRDDPDSAAAETHRVATLPEAADESDESDD